MAGYWDLKAQEHDISDVGNNFMSIFLASRQAKRAQLQQQREMMLQDRQIAEQDKQYERANDIEVARREAAQGRPDIMQNAFPKELLADQLQQSQVQNAQFEMTENKQKVRDKLLEQGLVAASANPSNWPRFVDYAEGTNLFKPGELDRNMSGDDALKALGKYRGEKIRQARLASPNQQFENTMKLQNAFTSQKIYPQLQETERALLSIKNAPDSVPGHMALVFGLMKLLDPNSVVRESEQAQAINATGLFGRLKNYSLMLEGNQKLNATQVSEMKQAAESLTQAYRDIYEKVARPYRAMAAKNGLDPDEVVMPIWKEGKPKAPTMTPEQEVEFTDLIQSGMSTDEALNQMGLLK